MQLPNVFVRAVVGSQTLSASSLFGEWPTHHTRLPRHFLKAQIRRTFVETALEVHSQSLEKVFENAVGQLFIS